MIVFFTDGCGPYWIRVKITRIAIWSSKKVWKVRKTDEKSRWWRDLLLQSSPTITTALNFQFLGNSAFERIQQRAIDWMSDHERVRKRADGSDSKIFGFARFMEKIRICSQQQQQRPIHSCVDNMGRHPHIVVILKFSSLTQWARFY